MMWLDHKRDIIKKPLERIFYSFTRKTHIMPEFKVEAPFQPTGDQPDAIDQLVEGIKKDYKYQTLLGVTGEW